MEGAMTSNDSAPEAKYGDLVTREPRVALSELEARLELIRPDELQVRMPWWE